GRPREAPARAVRRLGQDRQAGRPVRGHRRGSPQADPGDRMTEDLLQRELPAAIAKEIHGDTDAVLLAYQRRWVADDSALKVAEKSRRIGLTWAEASDNVLTAAASRQAGGQNVYYIGY